MENLEQQRNQSKEAKKIEAKYASSLALLVGVMRGKDNLVPLKADLSDVEIAIEELFEEDKKAVIETFKADVRVLLKQHLDFERSVKEETEKFNKVVLEKKKAFGDVAMKIFSKVKNIYSLQASYAKSVASIVKAGAEAEVIAKEDENEQGEEGLTES